MQIDRRVSLRCCAVICAALASAPLAAQERTGRGSFELGGTHRARYETLDPQFRAGFSNSDQALALQTTLTLDWQRDALRVFGEIMDSRTLANDSGSFAGGTTTNTLEPMLVRERRELVEHAFDRRMPCGAVELTLVVEHARNVRR